MVKVIFTDPDILVLDKSGNLVVTNSDTVSSNTLEEILKDQFKINLDRGGIVHRLDKDTSGLIVVAKTESALDNLQAQFKNRQVKKTYLALVHGWLESAGQVVGEIGRNPGNREKFTVLGDGSGKEAVTDYRPLQKLEMSQAEVDTLYPDFNKIQIRKLATSHFALFTLVECQPKTGRTHQIRVHLKHIGFPIVGDEKYVGRRLWRLDHRFCPRQFLHAQRLEFNHPTSAERIIFESDLPEDLKEVLKKLC